MKLNQFEEAITWCNDGLAVSFDKVLIFILNNQKCGIFYCIILCNCLSPLALSSRTQRTNIV